MNILYSNRYQIIQLNGVLYPKQIENLEPANEIYGQCTFIIIQNLFLRINNRQGGASNWLFEIISFFHDDSE